MNKEIGNVIARIRLVPVVVIENLSDAVPLARALVQGGLPIAEVTFRSEAALSALEAIKIEVPEILLGAGTVLHPAQVAAAKNAGARFIMTPGFNPAVVAEAKRLGILIVPGVNNPTGVEQALSCGLDVVKFFPAEPTGGVAFLKAMASPYRGMRFVPTGGIGPNNVADYLALPSVLACGGSWMVDPKLIAAGRFEEIAKLTRDAVATAQRSA